MSRLSPIDNLSPVDDLSPIDTPIDFERIIAEKDAQIRTLRAMQAKQRVEIGRLRRLATQQVTSLASALDSPQLKEAVTQALEGAAGERL